jgi:hypothetical protein
VNIQSVSCWLIFLFAFEIIIIQFCKAERLLFQTLAIKENLVSNGLVKWFRVKWVWDGQRELLVGFIWLTGVWGYFWLVVIVSCWHKQ